MFITYKYRLKNNRHTLDILNQCAQAVNFVWNYCVNIQRTSQRYYRLGNHPRWLSYFDFVRLTTGTSKDLKLRAHSIQDTCKQFVKSRDISQKCPRFRKSRAPRKALGWIPFQQQSRKIDGNSVTYYGTTFRWFGSKKRPLPEQGVKGGGFVEDSQGNWYVYFHVEVANTLSIGNSVVGIDLGLKHLATLSTGEIIENPKIFKKWEQKLATSQRSGNKKRTKAIYAKIKNTRQDFLHKTSAKIARDNKLIVVGNVSPSKLGKTKLAKSVNDVGWSTFRNMLEYKARKHQAVYLEVDERFTSQTCSSCGALPPERPKGIAGLGIREWTCSNCGTHHDRDVNAAKNILALGLGSQPLEEERQLAHAS